MNDSKSKSDLNDSSYSSPLNSADYQKNLNFFPNTSTSSFLRIYFKNSTAVVERKSISLKQSLSSKLKKNNLDIESCVAYSKENNLVIDWGEDISKINETNLYISLKCDIKHVFVKKLILNKAKFALNRSCDLCKRACNQGLFIFSCKKCDNILCHNQECKLKIEKTICLTNQKPKLGMNLIKTSASSVFNTTKPSLKQKWINLQNNSEQILPITQITICPPRARSLSDPDNILFKQESENSKKSSNKKEPLNDLNKKPSRWNSLLSWEIPPTRIQINKQLKIGTGSFGVVHKGTDFYHGVVAVKFISVNKNNPTQEQIKAFKNEVAILKSTRHDNILFFIGCFLSEQLAIVTEWCPGSSLYRHLHVDEVYWDMVQLVDIAKQTATGMEYLHAKDILHRDLKSNNIFLIPKEDNNNLNRIKKSKNLEKDFNVLKWTVKIGDFGLATVRSAWIENSSKKEQPTGSILWMAPEVIKQKVSDPYTHKSDVYSYGVVLYELVTSSLPFQNKEQNMVLFLVGSGRLKLNPSDSREDTPEQVKELIRICSEYDREKRPEFVEINGILNKAQFKKVYNEPKLKKTQSAPNILLNFNNHDDLRSLISHSDYNSDEFYLSGEEDYLEEHENNKINFYSSDDLVSNT